MVSSLIAAEILDYPFMVSIQEAKLEERHLCAGVIISLSWILTASHCLIHQGPKGLTKDELMREPSYYEAVGGTQDNNYGTKSACKIFLTHYNSSIHPKKFHQGLALIGLKELLPQSVSLAPVKFAPARKRFRNTIFGSRCNVVGWSGMNTGRLNKFQLVTFRVKVLPVDECAQIQYESDIDYSDQYICMEAGETMKWLDASAAVVCSSKDIVEAIVVTRIDVTEGPTVYLGLRLDFSALWITTRIAKPAPDLVPIGDKWC